MRVKKPCFSFCAFRRKTQFIGNFEKVLESFSMVFSRKLLKMHYLSIFSKDLTNHALFFRAVDEKRKFFGNFEKILKTFDEHSIEKNFYFFNIFLFLENLLLKIEPSEITPFFYNNIFGFGGMGFPAPSPWLRP